MFCVNIPRVRTCPPLSTAAAVLPPLPPLTMEGNSERGGANPPSRLTSEGWQVDRPAVAAHSSRPLSPPSAEGGSGGVNIQCRLPDQQQKQQQQSGPPHLPSPTSNARGVQGGLTAQQQQQTSPPTVSMLAHHAFNLYRECVGAGHWTVG